MLAYSAKLTGATRLSAIDPKTFATATCGGAAGVPPLVTLRDD
jgi:hypothetical protein